MAERRMFSRLITDGDRFLSLSSAAQALYMHLMMSADDDGFTSQVTIAQFRAHATEEDMKALGEAGYIHRFDDGVVVLLQWRMANAIRKDRYNGTVYKEHLKHLYIDGQGVYHFSAEEVVANRLPDGCRVVANLVPQDRIDKDRTGKYISHATEEIDRGVQGGKKEPISTDAADFLREIQAKRAAYMAEKRRQA